MHATRIIRGVSCALIALSAPLSGWAASNDLGATVAEKPQTVSIVFKLRRERALEDFIRHTVTPTSGMYRDFLTTEEFADRFGPTYYDFFTVLHFLRKEGITVNEIHSNRMVIRATGTTAQFNALLNTEIRDHEEHGRHFQKPNRKPHVPKDIQDLVLTVLGLDTQPAFRSHLINTQKAMDQVLGEPSRPAAQPQAGAVATGVPGSFTVGDVANMYNINPLYARRITGKGRTLGIATLATFQPEDAFGYWKALGLAVDPDRLTQIPVDGGAGTSGSDETTLDVQQAGGVAYGARIRVYEAPNSHSGFVDMFNRAVSDNQVDTLSVSWGLGEAFYDADTLQAFHQVFLQAAAQGIPVFASSGDSGAFDLNRNLATPFYAPVNSVDHPAADPYVVAAGGTTLPLTLERRFGKIVVPKERPWGWDYLKDYYVANYGQFYYDANLFPVGGGGGVSSTFAIPRWQVNLAGTQLTPYAFSSVLFYPNYTPDNPDTSGAQVLGELPGGFSGRNLPDVSLNADPFTGYLTYGAGQFASGSGGTSFVAPQLNGIAALLSQSAHGRLGALNPQLYELFRRYGYGPKSPFRPITEGTNLYWQAGPTYNPASGLGTLNVEVLAQHLSARPRW